MDSITHIVFGGVIGSAIAGEKIGKRAILWGAIANSIPDIDVITRFWMNDPDAMLAHRGLTHSLLFAFIVSPLLSWLLVKYGRNKNMQFPDWIMMFLSGMLFHVFIDCMTTYGTGLFEPFSHARISFNNIFVADPFFTIWFLIAFIVLLFLKKDSSKRKLWTQFGILMGTLYILYTITHKYRVDEKFKIFYTTNNISTKTYFSAPGPLNNWLWMGMAKDHDSIYTCYYSFFDKSPIQFYIAAPINDNLLDSVRNSKNVNTVLRLSQGYYSVQKENDKLVFSDTRFGMRNGWEKDSAQFVFQFNIERDKNNSINVKQAELPGINGKAFGMLIKRIKGN